MKKYDVPFITVEDADDLIVSFPLDEHATESLTLLRTPKYESLLPPEERGVAVEMGESGVLEKQLLKSVEWGMEVVTVATENQAYALNVEAVSAAEIGEAEKVVQKMNFDHSFELSNV